MSIIADALKKADNTPERQPQAAPPPENRTPKSTRIYQLALAGCAGLVLLGIAQVTRRPAAPGPAAPTPAARVVPAPPKKTAGSDTLGRQLLWAAQGEMALKGTLRSGDGKSLALINNEVVGQGDRVRGMTLTRVNPDSVELQDESGKTKTLKLED